MAKKAEEKTSREITDLTAEQEKVDAILAAIASLKANVQQTDPESAFIGELAGLEAELFTVTEGLSSKAERWSAAETTDTDDYVKASTDYGELYGNYNSLYGEFESVRQLIASYPADTARLLFEIQEKESALLQHEALTEDKKQQLEKIFNKAATSTETDELLAQLCNSATI